MKVKLLSNYDSSSNLLKRFKNNYIIEDNDIEFITEGEYDYAVVFNKSIEVLNKSAKVICIVQEPSFSPVWIGNDFKQWADYVIVHDKKLFNLKDEDFLEIFEDPSFMWFHDHVNYKFFNDASKLKKKKKISYIVSGLNMDIPNTNYNKRIDLLNKILESDLDIDIYGKGLNIDDSRFKGSLKDKFHGLIPYEYSIAIENSCEMNYITEKFIDCTISNTKPIYYGAPNINDVYKWYEPLNLESEDVIGDIKQIISKSPYDYNQYNIEDFNRYFEDYNLYKKIKNIINEISC